jgi:hypothetical protein
MILRALFALALLFAGASSTRAQSLVALWDFNSADTAIQLVPTSGNGTITLLGGVTVTSVSGTGSSDPATTGDQAINLTGFPAQGNAPRTAGIEIAAGTTGFRDIVLKFDFRSSNTGSRKIQVLYTVNGTDYVDGPSFVIATGGAFTNGLTADFSAVTAANDNPLFRVRVVSDFDGDAYAAVSGTYGIAGTWRFDYLTVSGNPSGAGPVAPSITGQPQDQTGFIGGSAQFGVTVGGTAPLSFQWRRNGEAIDGATAQTLVLTNLTANSQGRFSVVVTNAVGRAESQEAVLTVIPDPSATPMSIAQVRQAFLPTTETNTNNVNSATLYTVEGVVTTHVSLTTAGNALFYLQDDTAGIAVFWGGASFVPAAGDRLRVRGPGTYFNGLLQLVPGAAGGSVNRISTNNPLPTPRLLPLESLVTRQDGSGATFDYTALEAFEGSLVTLTNIQLALPEAAAISYPNGNNLTVYDSTGVAFDPTLFNFRVDARVTEMIGQPVPVGRIAVTAVLGQFDNLNPRTIGYQLLPTRSADVVTDSRPPVVRFTNVLSQLVRAGDLPTNTFNEITLLPGEKLTTSAIAFDVDGLPVQLAAADAPAGAEWSLSGSGTPSASATLTWMAGAADVGVAYAAKLHVWTSRATNTLVLQLYTPTVAEQGIVITEFMPAPTDATNSPAYNLLRRASYPNFTADASPGNLDEYVEVVNLGSESVDLIGWTLADAVSRTHQFFIPVTLASSNAVVLYGGPLNGSEPTLPAGVYFEPASLASGGRLLALNNGGDTLLLRNASSRLISRILYGAEGTNIASQVRNPSGTGAFVPHTSLGGRYGSPGLRTGGALWTETETAVVELPVVAVPPTSRTNIVGTLATFSVGVGGTPPFTYQWRFGSNPIEGATNATLSMENVQTANQGEYSVVVRNAAGAVTSESAVLTVVPDIAVVRTIAEVRATIADPATSTNDVLSAESFTVEGIVTTAVNLTTSTSRLFYIQDATAGIAVFWRNSTQLPALGDRVRVVAPIGFFNGLLQFAPNATNAATSVTVVGSGAALPTPAVLDAGSSDFALLENLEGRLVVMRNVNVNRDAATFGSGQNVVVTNAAGQTGVILRIDSRVTEIIGTARPTNAVDIVGVLSQFDSSNPRNTGYQVIPTRLVDIVPVVAHPPILVRVERLSGGSVRVLWNHVAGRTYRVLRSDTLGGVPIVAGEGALEGAFEDASASALGFYRIVAP